MRISDWSSDVCSSDLPLTISTAPFPAFPTDMQAQFMAMLTLAKVREALADLPLTWREGTSCTGAIATLEGAKPGRRVLLRGDMDALPIDEPAGLAFASQIPGQMHACGHDTHTAMLAAAARLLYGMRGEFSGTVDRSEE